MTINSIKYTLGDVVRFKNYKRNQNDKEAYFVVIQEASENQELVLFVLNSNRYYSSGTTIIPEYPDEDLERTILLASDLIHEKVVIKEHCFNDVVCGRVIAFEEGDCPICFHLKEEALHSNIKFQFRSQIKYPLAGNLFVRLDY
jgi:hypothetical protein